MSQIFSSTFEAGDLSEWDAESGSGLLSVTERAGLNGSGYGLEIAPGSAPSAHYVEKSLTPPAPGEELIIRFRLYTETLYSNSHNFLLAEVVNSIGTLLELNFERALYEYRAWGTEGDDNTGYTGDSVIPNFLPGGQDIRLVIGRATSATAEDGYIRYYRNDTLVAETINFDNYDKAGAITALRLGVCEASTDDFFGRLYVDDVTVHDAAASVPAYSPTTRSTLDTIIFADGFESGDVSAWDRPGNTAVTPTADGTLAIVSSPTPQEGTYEARLRIANLTSGSDTALRLFNKSDSQAHVRGETRYYSCWYYVPQVFDYSVGTYGSSNIMQFKVRVAGTYDDPWYVVRLGNNGTDDGNELHLHRKSVPGFSDSRQYAGFDVPIGEWFVIEVMYDMQTDATGTVIAWMNGVEIGRFEDTLTMDSDPDAHMQWSVNNYTDNVSPDPNDLYIDSASITTYETQAADADAPTVTMDSIHGPSVLDSVHEASGYDGVADTLTVTGTAADTGGSGLASVEVRVNGGAWQAATGTSTWSIDLDVSTFPVGVFDVEARATDGASNVSTLASRTVWHSPDRVWGAAATPGNHFDPISTINMIVSAWITSQSAYYDTIVPADVDADYFVDFDTGSDANDGTSWAQAKLTMQGAATLLSGVGGVVKVRGTTSALQTISSSGASGTPIEFWADSLHNASIDGTGRNTAVMVSADYVSIYGLEAYGADYNGIQYDPAPAPLASITVRYCYIRDILWPDGGTGGAHITMHGTDCNLSDNLIVGGVPGAGDAALTTMHGIYSRGTNHTVHNNLVVNIRGGYGLHAYSSNGPASQDGYSAVNNTCLHCNSGGGLVQATNMVVANNIFAHNDDEGGTGGGRGLRVWSSGSTGLVTHNLYWQNEGLDFDDAGGSGVTNDNPVFADPAFVNYVADGSGDYRVQDTGGAHQAGSDIYAPSLDYYGNPRSVTPTIGFAEIQHSGGSGPLTLTDSYPEVSDFSGSVYYIAPDGDGGVDGTGSSASPYKLWSTALPVLAPGDVLVVRSGTFTRAANGDFRADGTCSHGTDANRITVMAENERLARYQTDGYKGVSVARDYWDVWGLTVEARDNDSVSGTPNTVESVDGTQYTRFRRLLVFRNNRYFNCHGIFLGGRHSLAEECEVYAVHRHSVINWRSADNVVRRVYVNPRNTTAIAGGYGSGDGGDEGVSAYGGSRTLVENCIAQGPGYGYQVHGGTVNDLNGGGAGGHDNTFLGNLTYAAYNGYWTSTRDEGANRPTGNVFRNNLSIDNIYYGITIIVDDGTIHDRLTLYNTQGTWLRSVVDHLGTLTSEDMFTYLRNAIFWDGTTQNPTWGSGGEFDATLAHERFLVEHSHFYNNGGYVGTSYHNGTAYEDITDEAGSYQRDGNTDPAVGTFGAGAGKSLLWVPSGHPFVGAGKDGATIGADLRYAYIDGVLSKYALWTNFDGTPGFPHGAIVDFGTTDGFVLSNDPAVTPGDCLADVHTLDGIRMDDATLRQAAYGG